MRGKRNILGKKGVSMVDFVLFGIFISFISIVYVFIAVFGFVVANDYIFVDLQNLTETLESQGIVSSGTSALTQTYGEDFQNFNFHIDDFWMIAYIIFVVTSLMAAYRARRMNYFGYLSMIVYGIMVILFLLTLVTILTEWFRDEIMLPMFPAISILVPKFYFYLNNIGIFSAIHLLVALFINIVDFDFGKLNQKRKSEQKELMNDEIL